MYAGTMKCKAHPLFYYVSVATAACVEPLFFGKFDMHIYITLNTFVLASKVLRRNFSLSACFAMYRAALQGALISLQ